MSTKAEVDVNSGGGADHAITLVLKNRSKSILTLKAKGMEHGVFTSELSPPERIAAGSVAEPSSGAWRGENTATFAAPVKGWLYYTLDDGKTELGIGFHADSSKNGLTMEVAGPKASDYSVQIPVISIEKCCVAVLTLDNA